MNIPPAAFHAAAALVLGRADDSAALGRSLLAALAPEGPPLCGWPDPADLAALLRAAAGFTRVFQLPVPGGDGLVAFGAELDLLGALGPGLAGVSGIGMDRLSAFRACIGEGVELRSQCLEADDPVRRAPARALPAGLVVAAAGEMIDWLPLHAASDGAAVLMPLDLCLRRPPAERDVIVPWPLSIGCAAGRDAASARLRALLELLERDAVALWWRGGRRGRPLLVPPRPGPGAGQRETRLLDITTDLTVGLPVTIAAAWSTDAAGQGFCCGTAARTSPESAARAALMELRQMELAMAVVEAKRAQRGEAALNPRDQAHLRRYHGITAACALLHPETDLPDHPRGAPHQASAGPAAMGPATAAGLAAGLEGRGIPVLWLDLTRPPLGIAVCRAVAPGLEMEPGRPPGPRLVAICARTGGADTLTGGVPLL